MADLTPACVWRTTPRLIVLLDGAFGEPVDCYVNGSQVWLRDDGPGGIALEWRLHPVAGYVRPPGIDTYEVFSTVALRLVTGGDAALDPSSLWDGLEAFPAYGDEVEPVPLVTAATLSLGVAPDVSGLVDHSSIGDSWERVSGRLSIVDALFAQLAME